MASTFHENARMAKKAVEVAWQEFCLLFPTKESCVEHLYKTAQAAGMIRCHNCLSTDLKRKAGARFSLCNRCMETTWFTSNTFFERVKNIRAWMAAIWLMERGLSISSNALAAVVGMAPSSALNLLKKLRLVICDNMGEEADEVSSKLFEELFCKRSRETPAGAHPRAEQEELDKQVGANAVVEPDGSGYEKGQGKAAGSDSVEAEAGLDHGQESETWLELEKQRIAQTLSADQQLVFGFLRQEPVLGESLINWTELPAPQVSVALMELLLSGLAKQLDGDRFVLTIKESECRSPQSPAISAEQEASLAKARDWLKKNLHGFSRKAAQFYLADYWRTFWPSSYKAVWGENSLLTACLRSDRISDDQIVAYVTPPLVRFVAAP